MVSLYIIAAVAGCIFGLTFFYIFIKSFIDSIEDHSI